MDRTDETLPAPVAKLNRPPMLLVLLPVLALADLEVRLTAYEEGTILEGSLLALSGVLGGEADDVVALVRDAVEDFEQERSTDVNSAVAVDIVLANSVGAMASNERLFVSSDALSVIVAFGVVGPDIDADIPAAANLDCRLF